MKRLRDRKTEREMGVCKAAYVEEMLYFMGGRLVLLLPTWATSMLVVVKASGQQVSRARGIYAAGRRSL